MEAINILHTKISQLDKQIQRAAAQPLHLENLVGIIVEFFIIII